MATSALAVLLTGEVLDDHSQVTLIQLCRTFSIAAETVEELVEHGILEPASKRGCHWCFPASSIKRTRVAIQLQRDLGVNLAGAALALELLERIDALHAQLRATGSS